ncbi:MAG: DUF3168 domain-containing protein [Pseudomonadota bacterium]
MSYAVAAALQSAVYDRLIADPAVDALLSGQVFDAAPTGNLPDIYAVIGAEDVRDASDKSSSGAWHRFTVTLVTQQAGFASVKQAAAAICDALIDAPLTLTRGRLVALHFHRARAARVGADAQRRINLIFRARVADDP